MTITDYRNFDLLITRAGARYRAFVVDAPAGEASVLFDLPFAPDEIAHLGGLARRVPQRPSGDWYIQTSPWSANATRGSRDCACVFIESGRLADKTELSSI